MIYERHCECVSVHVCANQKTFIEMNSYETNALCNSIAAVWCMDFYITTLIQNKVLCFVVHFTELPPVIAWKWWCNLSSERYIEKENMRRNNVWIDTGDECSLKQITCKVVEERGSESCDSSLMHEHWARCTKFNMLG